MGLFKIFRRNKQTIPVETPKQQRRYVKDVKPGEIITIEWSKCVSKITKAKCLNNDTITKKILLEIKWGNYREYNISEYEQIIVDYDSDKLTNFHLLNSYNQKVEENEPSDDELDERINDKLEEKLSQLPITKPFKPE